MIAATALRHGFTPAARNVRDFEHSGVDIFDPFRASSSRRLVSNGVGRVPGAVG
jgi:hypothetical protein